MPPKAPTSRPVIYLEQCNEDLVCRGNTVNVCTAYDIVHSKVPVVHDILKPHLRERWTGTNLATKILFVAKVVQRCPIGGSFHPLGVQARAAEGYLVWLLLAAMDCKALATQLHGEMGTQDYNIPWGYIFEELDKVLTQRACHSYYGRYREKENDFRAQVLNEENPDPLFGQEVSLVDASGFQDGFGDSIYDQEQGGQQQGGPSSY